MQETERPAGREPAVGPLERGLAVLRTLAAEHGPARPADLARATGLARSTVDRIAATLVRLGYLRTVDGRDLLPAPRLLELGDAYLAASGLADPLEPLAAGLADRLDESVSLAVPDGDGIRFVTQATRRRAMSLSFRIGDLLPAERCAPGALFAAGWGEEQWGAWRARRRRDPLDAGFSAVPPRASAPAEAEVEAGFAARVTRARTEGYVVDDQLIEPGLVAVAVPVAGPEGRPVAALSVVSHTSRHSAADLAGWALGDLRATAARMAEVLRSEQLREEQLRAEQSARGAAVREAEAPALPWSAADKAELGAEYLQSLARGLSVLTALGAARGGLTLSEAALAAQLPRATARRSLLTLQQLGYVGTDPRDPRRFRPLPAVLGLGHTRVGAPAFAEIAEPHLAELSALLGESTSVAVLDGDDIRYVARVAMRRIMSVNIQVGTRFPAHATSMGRVLLAGLPAPERARYLDRLHPEALTPRTVTGRTRLEQILHDTALAGHALVDQELEEGLRSLAVPVHDRAGRVAAALNVSLHAGPDRRPPEEDRAELLPALRATATRLEADLALVARRRPLRLD